MTMPAEGQRALPPPGNRDHYHMHEHRLASCRMRPKWNREVTAAGAHLQLLTARHMKEATANPHVTQLNCLVTTNNCPPPP